MATIESADPQAAQQSVKKRGLTPSAGLPLNTSPPQPTNGVAVNGAAPTSTSNGNGSTDVNVNMNVNMNMNGSGSGSANSPRALGLGFGATLSAGGEGLSSSMFSSGISSGSAAEAEAGGSDRLQLLSPSSDDARAVSIVYTSEPDAELAPDNAPSRQGYAAIFTALSDYSANTSILVQYT